MYDILLCIMLHNFFFILILVLCFSEHSNKLVIRSSFTLANISILRLACLKCKQINTYMIYINVYSALFDTTHIIIFEKSYFISLVPLWCHIFCDTTIKMYFSKPKYKLVRLL